MELPLIVEPERLAESLGAENLLVVSTRASKAIPEHGPSGETSPTLPSKFDRSRLLTRRHCCGVFALHQRLYDFDHVLA